MTEQELQRLEALEQAATGAPWSEFCESGDWWVSRKDEFDGPGDWVFNSNTDFWNKQEDVDFVVAARNALPALIAEVRRLRAIIAQIEARRDELARRAAEQRGIPEGIDQ